MPTRGWICLKAPQSDLLQPLPGGSLAAETRAIRKRLSGIRLIRQNRSAPACVRPPAPAAPAIESLAKRIVRVIRSAREQHHAGPELEIVGRAENRMKGRTFACKHGPGANIRPRHRCRRGVARDQFRIAERARRLRASVGRTARAGAAGTAIAFCSDEERPYLRDIEKLMRRSLRVIPLATPAARNDPIERPAKAKLPRDASLASRQAPARGRAAPARHPPQPGTADIRRRDPSAGGSFPAFPRRASSTKRGSAGRRGEHRSHMQTRGSPTYRLEDR